MQKTRTTDVLNKVQRSYCMSRIRSRDTTPEVLLRKALWKRGLRYRIHHSLPGRPDIVFPSRRIAIFVDGCFWHRCPKHWQAPKNNAEFWEQKIGLNEARDAQVNRQLEAKGWKVIRVWEHEIKEALTTTIDSLVATIQRAET
ncbi:MAG: very short patch repair endonuclease [Lamprobacter sp.]|uniref:very short patch repair endonuclease n=1 Tax=Lamprobacter sp. TaxID=3100796 RepID=UPI002B25D692|nr:very short patch repair endonuclease [Lamprobacter sp.]MEA3640227.1 very short patch repair endonuclease [Lamprobacter sp.]